MGAGVYFAVALTAVITLVGAILYLNVWLRSLEAVHNVDAAALLMLTDRLNWATAAMYATAIIYSVSLYRCKPTETYLLYFCAYACIMLAWALLIKLDRTASVVIWSEYFLYVYCGVFGMKLCSGLTRAALPGLLSWIEKPCFYPVSAAWVLAYIGANRLGVNALKALILLSPYVICLYILSCAAAQHRRGAVILLAAMTLLVGMRPSLMPDTFSQVFGKESLVMKIMRENMRIHEMLFVLAAMLYVNREFAWQFAEKERLAAHLDELVQERTKRLIDAQAQRQSMMLNIFHDVRTPLTVMRGALDAMKVNPASSEAMLPLISSRLDFVTELTDDLFLAAKLEDKQVLITCSRVSLSEVALEQAEQARRLASEAGIRLEADIEPGLVVWGEKRRLAQIAQNLLTNAVHYTQRGGIIAVTLKREADRAVLRVRDSGKGISPEEQTHIFDRYFHTTAANKHESSGLGLTIAHELTLLHRGTLTVESEIGRGTTFVAAFALLDEERGN